MRYHDGMLCEWQKIDRHNNMIMPWLTHKSLEVIKSWDLAEKRVLEYGGGYSTLWWANMCKEVVTIDHCQEWVDIIKQELKYWKYKNVQLHHRPANEGNQLLINFYTEIPEGFVPDIVVVDGIMRYECMRKALDLPRPLTLIVDNWQQDYVFICPAAEELMESYKGKLYIQPDHTNHEGRPWTTAIWHLT